MRRRAAQVEEGEEKVEDPQCAITFSDALSDEDIARIREEFKTWLESNGPPILILGEGELAKIGPTRPMTADEVRNLPRTIMGFPVETVE